MATQDKKAGTGGGVAVGILLALAIVVAVFFFTDSDLFSRLGLDGIHFGRSSSESAQPATVGVEYEQPAAQYGERFRTLMVFETNFPGYYKIATLLDESYVLEHSYSDASRGDLFLGADDDSSAQRFRLDYVSDDCYVIKSDITGLALTYIGDPYDSSSWSAVELRAYTGDDTQIWQIVPANDSCFYIINLASGLFLDVSNASAQEGNPVGVFRQNEAYNAQKWILTEDLWG